MSLGGIASVRVYLVTNNNSVCNHHAFLSRLSSRFCSRLFREANQVPWGHSFPMLGPGLTLLQIWGSLQVLCLHHLQLLERYFVKLQANAPCLRPSLVSHHVRHAVMQSSFLPFHTAFGFCSHLEFTYWPESRRASPALQLSIRSPLLHPFELSKLQRCPQDLPQLLPAPVQDFPFPLSDL